MLEFEEVKTTLVVRPSVSWIVVQAVKCHGTGAAEVELAVRGFFGMLAQLALEVSAPALVAVALDFPLELAEPAFVFRSHVGLTRLLSFGFG